MDFENICALCFDKSFIFGYKGLCDWSLLNDLMRYAYSGCLLCFSDHIYDDVAYIR